MSRFSPYINAEGEEESKCIKFESGLRPKIYQYVGFHRIRDFATLVNKCRMFDEASKAKPSFYKAVNEKKGMSNDRGKPYGNDNGKKKDFGDSSKPSRGDEVKCKNCGRFGHRASDCKSTAMSCIKCEKTRHRVFVYKSKEIVCYNFGEVAHQSTKCKKPNKAGGKVFALNAEEVEQPDNLIRSISFINSTPLIAIHDTGATHSFIYLSCDERLNLALSPMLRGMIIDTPTNGSVTTSFVCLKCPVNFGNVDFALDFVCLPLVHINVILGIDWMLSFGVNQKCDIL